MNIIADDMTIEMIMTDIYGIEQLPSLVGGVEPNLCSPQMCAIPAHVKIGVGVICIKPHHQHKEFAHTQATSPK